jgi:Holliday junction resolvasome RuvABC ATP-dependent DNA helicase subunit
MRKRWVAPTPIENNDEQLLTALCPQRLDEYIGQQMVKGVANIAEARQNKRTFLNALKTMAFGEGCLKG